MSKPGRTLGVILAIAMGVVWFVLLPLYEAVLALVSRERLQGVMLAGGNMLPNTDTDLMLAFRLVGSAAFLVVAVLAWRGRPARVRFVFVGVVVVFALVYIMDSLGVMTVQQVLPQGIDSSGDISRALASARLVVTVLVSLFIVWYMNRGPARAFYRGYFLERGADGSAVRATRPTINR